MIFLSIQLITFDLHNEKSGKRKIAIVDKRTDNSITAYGSQFVFCEYPTQLFLFNKMDFQGNHSK